MITLSKDEMSGLLEGVKADLVRALLQDLSSELQLLTQAQVCGILDVTVTTLNTLPIPKVQVIQGKVIRYRVSDVVAFLESRRG